MSIRVFRQGDLPAIFDIYASSKLDELKFEDQAFSLLPLDQDNARLASLMESDIYVYQGQEGIYGYGAIFGDEIRALFVRPESRGKHVGKRLLEFLLSLIKGQPYLYVASSNQYAKGLYQQFGFLVTDTFKTTYNEQEVFAQKMVCILPQKNDRSPA